MSSSSKRIKNESKSCLHYPGTKKNVLFIADAMTQDIAKCDLKLWFHMTQVSYATNNLREVFSWT